MVVGRHSRPASTSTASSLMQDVPGSFPARTGTGDLEDEEPSFPQSLSQAVYARRAEYVKPKHVRIKIGTWNVAAYKGTEKDIGAWFVEGKGVAEALAGLQVKDQTQTHGDDVPDQAGLDEREDVAAQEARYARKQETVPKKDPGSIIGEGDVGLYVLGLQEVVDVNSVSEALRPYTDASVAKKWKESMEETLPAGYQMVAEQQLIGLLLLIYAAPDVAREVRSVSTTSVGTGLAGYMGNKGAVTARLVLGDTTRLVFVNCHLAAGADKTSLERRNWDASQIVSRTRFEPIQDAMDLSQTTGEQIGDEDFIFWVGDLNYRLEGIPGDDVRRLLMLHSRNEYDLSQQSAKKIENELQNATESVKQRVDNRTSTSSDTSQYSASESSARTSTDTQTTAPTTLMDEIEASDDPTSLHTTLASLLPHDELHQQMKARKAFHDGWQEGPINFIPTYKYDVGSVGVFDSSEKKRAPSWCDRILYRTRRERLAYEAMVKEEENARKKDEEMKAAGTDQAGEDDEILYDYDPETDGADNDNDGYNEYDDCLDADEGVVITKEGFEDEITLQSYVAHQRILSSDHKPLDAVFMLKYDAIVPSSKAQIHAEVAKELDKAENESRPDVTVVVDKHRADDLETSDDNPSNFEGVWFGDVRWGQAKHRSLTIANTGRVPATFTLIPRPTGPGQTAGIAPKWLNLTVNGSYVHSSSEGAAPVHLDPGSTAHLELEVRIFDVHTVQVLNEGIQNLDDILVLRVDGGRDHFIPLRGNWQDSSLGRGITKLIRIPEGGIRKLQNQRPDGSKGPPSRPTSGAWEPDPTTPSGVKPWRASQSLDDNAPVRFSAPRELFRLTEAIESLSAHVVAEHGMISESDAPAPWTAHPGWPFEEACWLERDTEVWKDALSELCNALDADLPLEPAWPTDLPRLQRLYVLCSFLLTFLAGMPDGVVPAPLFAQIDSYLSTLTSAKTKPTTEEQRTAIQELLSQSPSHSISFVLITSMLDRLLQETHSPNSAAAAPSPPTSPSKRAGPFRRMTGLGKVPASAPGDERGKAAAALAKCFVPVTIRLPEKVADKARAGMEKRRVELIEVFLRRDAVG